MPAPIPTREEPTMQLNPYLFYDGQCEPAFKLYPQVLHGDITAMMRHGGAPGCEDMPAGSA
ncbi:MAG: hypothetical protein ABIY40_05165 [Rhodanobacteraceae bacterium]